MLLLLCRMLTIGRSNEGVEEMGRFGGGAHEDGRSRAVAEKGVGEGDGDVCAQVEGRGRERG